MSSSQFNCENCKFISTNKKNYNRHLLTKKHKTNNPVIPLCQPITNDLVSVDPTAPEEKVKHTCECGKHYSFINALEKHKQKCLHHIPIINRALLDSITDETDITSKIRIYLKVLNDMNKNKKNITPEMLKEKIEISDKLNVLLAEQHKNPPVFEPISPNENTITTSNETTTTEHNTTTTNTTKTYDIDVYLNTKCTDPEILTKMICIIVNQLSNYINSDNFNEAHLIGDGSNRISLNAFVNPSFDDPNSEA